MNLQQFGSATTESDEYVSLVLEKREIEAAIGALIALDLSRGSDHPAITSAISSLRTQLKNYVKQAA